MTIPPNAGPVKDLRIIAKSLQGRVNHYLGISKKGDRKNDRKTSVGSIYHASAHAVIFTLLENESSSTEVSTRTILNKT